MKINGSIRDYILTNYNQVLLFAKYLDIKPKLIEICINDKSFKINNPLRKDIHASLGFMFTEKGKLIMKDWANNLFTGDIFDLVGIINKLDSNNSVDFIKICNIIMDDNSMNCNKNIHKYKKIDHIIEFKAREFNKFDYMYWMLAGVSVDYLKFRNVYAAKHVWIDDMNIPYFTHTDDKLPTYVYYLGKKGDRNKIKTYSPFESRHNKFRTNVSDILEGINELYKADNLIISKSRKDKLVIECNLYDNGVRLSDKLYGKGENFKYCVTNFTSESLLLSSDFVNKLKSVYNKIILNLDYDKQGISTAFYHKMIYNIDTLFVCKYKNIIISDFTDNELKYIINNIHKSNNNINISVADLYNYLSNNLERCNSKDMYDYFTTNGINNGITMLNNKIENYV